MLGVETSTPSRGVFPAADDVVGVAVIGVPARIVESILYGSLSDAVVHRGCLRTGCYDFLALPCWWSVHRSLVVLVRSPSGRLRYDRAHARCRALGLLHSGLLDEHLCLAAQVAARKRQ